MISPGIVDPNQTPMQDPHQPAAMVQHQGQGYAPGGVPAPGQQGGHPNGYYPPPQQLVYTPGGSTTMQPLGIPYQQTSPQALHYSETGQRVTSSVGPQVKEGLERLATAYDNELEDKEKDIAQAHSLLSSIQAEVLENKKIIKNLKAQTESLEEAGKKESSLREDLNDKMGKRFRLGWEKYVRDEEERQKDHVSITKNEGGGGNNSASNSNGTSSSSSAAAAPTATASNGHSITFTSQSNGANGKSSVPADLQQIFKQPGSSESLAEATRMAQNQLEALKAQRRELFDTFVSLQASIGTSGSSGTGSSGSGSSNNNNHNGSNSNNKMMEYRKLIGLGCGIPAHEVDDTLIKNLLESLDTGEDAYTMQMQQSLPPMAGGQSQNNTSTVTATAPEGVATT